MPAPMSAPMMPPPTAPAAPPASAAAIGPIAISPMPGSAIAPAAARPARIAPRPPPMAAPMPAPSAALVPSSVSPPSPKCRRRASSDMRSVTSSRVYPRLLNDSYARSALSRSLNIPVISRECFMTCLLCWFVNDQNLEAKEVPSRDAVAPDRVLVPVNSGTGPRRGLDHPVHRPERLGEHERRHVEVLDVVTARRHRQQVSAHLDEEVARARHAGRLCQRRRAEPARHPADLLRVGHDEVARLQRQRQLHLVHTVEVLADLDGCRDLRGDLGGRAVIVGAHGLLDPAHALAIEYAPAADRL